MVHALEKRREATRAYLLRALSTGVFGHHQGTGDSLWDSLFGTPGVRKLTDDDIQNMPYASSTCGLTAVTQLFVVLAFSKRAAEVR
ncbi:hypothetical protein KCP78_21385 [Salmonella enterica subsp. enterica]|nr:hypothetical protein KCP78_21385 [Salmonella enterica subsp. enterica]